jgi:hypothetical protein
MNNMKVYNPEIDESYSLLYEYDDIKNVTFDKTVRIYYYKKQKSVSQILLEEKRKKEFYSIIADHSKKEKKTLLKRLWNKIKYKKFV